MKRENKDEGCATEVLDMSAAQCRSSGLPHLLYLGSCSELAEEELSTAHGTDANPRQRGPCSACHTMGPDGPED